MVQEYGCQASITLKRRKNEDAAKLLLKRLIAQVTPIMKKRKWTVGCVREFFPKDRNLLGLNINHGSEIRIRLRSPSSPDSFLVYEDLLGTLLHELVHNDVGPHNSAFYRILDKLKYEAATLITKGIYGSDAFETKGQKLGSSSRASLQTGGTLSRAALLRKREEWFRRMQLSTGSGQQLGSGAYATSNSIQSIAKTPAEAAAIAALRRAAADQKWCGDSQECTEAKENDVYVSLGRNSVGLEGVAPPSQPASSVDEVTFVKSITRATSPASTVGMKRKRQK
jgi:DNA-dependent metalloprotease WSS1